MESKNKRMKKSKPWLWTLVLWVVILFIAVATKSQTPPGVGPRVKIAQNGDSTIYSLIDDEGQDSIRIILIDDSLIIEGDETIRLGKEGLFNTDSLHIFGYMYFDPTTVLDSALLDSIVDGLGRFAGAGGLSYWTESDTEDTSIFTATGPNTTVGFEDNLTMRGNNITGVGAITSDGNDGDIISGFDEVETDTITVNSVPIYDFEGTNLSVTAGVLNASGGSGLWAESNDSTWLLSADNESTFVITDNDAGYVKWGIGTDQDSVQIGDSGVTAITNLRLGINDGSDKTWLFPTIKTTTNGHILKYTTTGDSLYWAADATGSGIWEEGTDTLFAIDSDGDTVAVIWDDDAGNVRWQVATEDQTLRLLVDTLGIGGDVIAELVSYGHTLDGNTLKLDTADAVADAETKPVTGNAVYDFCETTQDYLKSTEQAADVDSTETDIAAALGTRLDDNLAELYKYFSRIYFDSLIDASGDSIVLNDTAVLSEGEASDIYAPLADPTFTGTVTIPTPFTLGATSVTSNGAELNLLDGLSSVVETETDPTLTDDSMVTIGRSASDSSSWIAMENSGAGVGQIRYTDRGIFDFNRSCSTNTNLKAAGDLYVWGDDIFATTNNAGYIWIGDNTNYNPTQVTGDVTITSGGVTSIGSNVVDTSDMVHASVGKLVRDTIYAQPVTPFRATIIDPDGLSTDTVMIADIGADEYPNGITITDIRIVCRPEAPSNYTVTFYETTEPDWDGSESTIEAVTISSGNHEGADNGTIDDGDIATGAFIIAILPSTDIDQLTITIVYKVDQS